MYKSGKFEAIAWFAGFPESKSIYFGVLQYIATTYVLLKMKKLPVAAGGFFFGASPRFFKVYSVEVWRGA